MNNFSDLANEGKRFPKQSIAYVAVIKVIKIHAKFTCVYPGGDPVLTIMGS